MKREIPVLRADGTVAAGRQPLLTRLWREAAAGRVQVNAYRGTNHSEAFYRLSDGTLLHEVNEAAEDGTPYCRIWLVVEEAEPGLFQRLLERVIFVRHISGLPRVFRLN
ncbi:MAG: hypothetical protein AB1791_14370 [Chloroflexota bacterium]